MNPDGIVSERPITADELAAQGNLIQAAGPVAAPMVTNMSPTTSFPMVGGIPTYDQPTVLYDQPGVVYDQPTYLPGGQSFQQAPIVSAPVQYAPATVGYTGMGGSLNMSSVPYVGAVEAYPQPMVLPGGSFSAPPVQYAAPPVQYGGSITMSSIPMGGSMQAPVVAGGSLQFPVAPQVIQAPVMASPTTAFPMASYPPAQMVAGGSVQLAVAPQGFQAAPLSYTQAAAPAPADTNSLFIHNGKFKPRKMTCPPGKRSGDQVEVIDPKSGQAVCIRIPPGVEQGQDFKVGPDDVVTSPSPFVGAYTGAAIQTVAAPIQPTIVPGGSFVAQAPSIAAPVPMLGNTQTLVNRAPAAILSAPSQAYGAPTMLAGGSVQFSAAPQMPAPGGSFVAGGSVQFSAAPQMIQQPVVAPGPMVAGGSVQFSAAPQMMAPQMIQAPAGGSVQFSAAPQMIQAPAGGSVQFSAGPQYAVAPQMMQAPTMAPASMVAGGSLQFPVGPQVMQAPAMAPAPMVAGGSLQFPVGPQFPVAPQMMQAAPFQGMAPPQSFQAPFQGMAPPPAQTSSAGKKETMRKMTCPPGFKGGDQCQVMDPMTGLPGMIQIPKNVKEGETFKVRVMQ